VVVGSSIASISDVSAGNHGRSWFLAGCPTESEHQFSYEGSVMQYLHLIPISLLTAIVLIFTAQNLELVTVAFLNAEVTVPRAALVMAIYILGMFSGGFVVSLIKSLLKGASKK
jgi:putative membrane protein